MKNQYPKSIFELIDSEDFRKKTAMYLGKKSISILAHFVNGYNTCELFHSIKPKDTKPPFWLFFRWICKYYNHSSSYYNWDGIILQNCENDEEKALDIFFERFDEFRKFKPIEIRKCKPDEKDIDFFHSHEGVRRRYEKGEWIRIGPVEELYIIDYGKEFGNTIHQRTENKNISLDYCRTNEEGIKIIEQEYGKSLKWKRVPLFDIEKIYEEIN